MDPPLPHFLWFSFAFFFAFFSRGGGRACVFVFPHTVSHRQCHIYYSTPLSRRPTATSSLLHLCTIRSNSPSSSWTIRFDFLPVIHFHPHQTMASRPKKSLPPARLLVPARPCARSPSRTEPSLRPCQKSRMTAVSTPSSRFTAPSLASLRHS